MFSTSMDFSFYFDLISSIGFNASLLNFPVVVEVRVLFVKILVDLVFFNT